MNDDATAEMRGKGTNSSGNKLFATSTSELLIVLTPMSRVYFTQLCR